MSYKKGVHICKGVTLMAFDGIVTKAITSELQQLVGGRIDKIYEPNKNEVVLDFYLNGVNYALNICTNSQNYRINLTTHSKPNPKTALNFCMLLRKNLIGLRIKNIISANLERVVTIEFEGFDDIDDIITKKLIIELMGRHCNIILVDENNIIIDSLRHISSSDNELTRNIIPHVKYIYPTTNKLNFLEVTDSNDFKLKLNYNEITVTQLPSYISNIFNGISKNFVKHIIKTLNIDSSIIVNDKILEQIYNYINDIIISTDSLDLSFEIVKDSNGVTKDYVLTKKKVDKIFPLNFFIDDYYFNKESSEEFKIYRNSISKLILDTLKKYNKRLFNINEKLKECDNMDKYKLYGELITANLYRIKNSNIDKLELENYYDNNSIITIPLDKRYSPSHNAKLFFKKYNKLKNALTIVGKQKQETLKDLDYIESVVYELETCSSIDDITNIFEEISESSVFKERTDKYKEKKHPKVKKSKLTKNKNVNFNPIKYKIEDYTLLVGRNNTENDYLTLKYAKKTDIWFHTKDIHGSHCILVLNNRPYPDNDILIKCSEITAYHSKARNSSNVPVDFCEVKYVKKPNGSKPGMVIYKNNKTLNVNPKIGC